MNRRAFLIRSGWLAGGITVLSSCSLIPAIPSGKGSDEDVISWVKLLPNGAIQFYCPRSEMGQGIDSGLSLIVAEELDMDPSKIHCLMPRTDQINQVQNTVGSMSMENYFLPVALAAANLRAHLMQLVRKDHEGAKVHQEGEGFRISDKKYISYAHLAEQYPEEVILETLADPAPVLRSLKSSKYIGTQRRMAGGDQIVRGAMPFVRDVVVPDMMFGAVLKRPFVGAKLLSVDKLKAASIESILGIYEGPEFLPGIVARTPMALRKAMKALQPSWQTSSDALADQIHPDLDVDRSSADGIIKHEVVSLGTKNVVTSKHFEHRIDSQMMAHASMEPRSGVAHVTKQKADIWTASQDPFFMSSLVAKLLDMAESRVVVRNHRLGGGFGGRVLCQATVEAAWLSQQAGVPVKVQWSREDEFSANYVGPEFSHRFNVGLDEHNKIVDWRHDFVASPIIFSSLMIPKPAHWVLDKIKDPGVARGALPIYTIANQQVNFASVRTGQPTGPWRGLGAAPNTFAVERTMDELAKSVSEDEIEFRLRHIDDVRLINVIKRVRSMSAWQTVDSSSLGFACTIYKDKTYVAIVAETEWQGDKPKLKNLWCAQDCGRVISPDRVMAQIEGNLTWGIGMALIESYRMADGKTLSTNFDAYPIARQEHSCAMNIELMSSTKVSSGAGEAAFAPAAAAIVNSLGKLRGTSYTRLPLKLSV